MKTKIRVLSEKINNIKSDLKTEEATKTSLVLPFLQILGYDIFNPKEVTPEFTCDVGTKKGEKIDYLISKDNNPLFLIECKKWSESLDGHKNQLLRYYHTSKAKFGILTNGIVYDFYVDSNNPNVMDEKPFFRFDFNNFCDSDLEILIKFSKNSYNEEILLQEIEKIKYSSKFKNVILSELSEPSREFAELIIRKIYSGRLTKKQYDLYFNILTDCLKDLFPSNVYDINVVSQNTTGIITTEEEIELFKYIIKNFSEYSERISYRDFKGHFSIVFDGSIRKCIIKVLFNGKRKYIIYNNSEEIKEEYVQLSDINLNYIKEIILNFISEN